MKKSLLVLLLFLTNFIAHAQFKTIAESPVFKEPEDGLIKLIQLKNGNTFLILINKKKEFNIRIYDASHKEKTNNTIRPDVGKAKKASISQIFEVNGNVIVFIESTEDREPSFFRIILDGNNGSIKEQVELFNMGRVSLGNAYGMVFAKLPPPSFFIRKDKHSDYYSITIFNTLESDRNKRVQLFMYDENHKEVSKAYVKSPGNVYKYLTFEGMTMMNKKIYLLSKAYNTKSSGDPEQKDILLATLTNGDTVIKTSILPLAEKLLSNRSLLISDSANNNLILVSNDQVSKKEFVSYITTIDPETSKILKSQKFFPTKADEKSRELFGKKEGFESFPNLVGADIEGNTVVGYEDRETKEVSYTQGHYHIQLERKNTAFLFFNRSMNETKTYLIPKRFFFPKSEGGFEGNTTILESGSQFKADELVFINNKYYYFLNDVAENEENVRKGKIQKINGVKECDAFYFELTGDDIIPTRHYLFSEPQEKKTHPIIIVNQLSYNTTTNTIAVLKLTQRGSNEGMNVVWMKP